MITLAKEKFLILKPFRPNAYNLYELLFVSIVFDDLADDDMLSFTPVSNPTM